MSLLFLLLFLTTPKHTYKVNSRPAVVSTTLKEATAYYIEMDGTIWTCGEGSFAMYVQPMSKKTLAFFYVSPPTMVHESVTEKYAVACLEIK